MWKACAAPRPSRRSVLKGCLQGAPLGLNGRVASHPEQGRGLRETQLRYGELRMAVLWKVDLRRAASTGAEEVTKEQEDQADSLKGATLPNGQ